MSISDNQDMIKIFATVFRIVTDFFGALPVASVSITGNTPLKRQLYNRIVRNNLTDLLQYYEVIGVFKTGDREIFVPFADYFTLIIDYQTFILKKHGKRKKSNTNSLPKK